MLSVLHQRSDVLSQTAYGVLVGLVKGQFLVERTGEFGKLILIPQYDVFRGVIAAIEIAHHLADILATLGLCQGLLGCHLGAIACRPVGFQDRYRGGERFLRALERLGCQFVGVVVTGAGDRRLGALHGAFLD